MRIFLTSLKATKKVVSTLPSRINFSVIGSRPCKCALFVGPQLRDILYKMFQMMFETSLALLPVNYMTFN
ncbi:hypothetical protein C0J52_15845 [Blattella germanica]|nr:hypothetical protein C0J52_15845 [Blattella germanica]